MNNLELFFQKYDLTNNQQKLVKRLNYFLFDSNNNCFLLKGYAGTGKTFITKGLTEYFREIGRNYILSAPTGKASKVIQEKTKSKAFTIHKTIYSNRDLKEYKSSENDRTYKFYFELAVNENSNDTVYIVDEASMLSNVYNEMEFFRFGSGLLLQDLIKYINLDQNYHNKKVIFIGDNAQLPPVGMNFSPALNNNYLIEKFGLRIEEFKLTEVVRQKEDSGILKNAFKLRKSLKNKVFNQLDIDMSYPDISHLEHSDFINKYLEVSNHKINKNTMVIAYTNASVKEYNQTIRKYFFNSIDTININDKIIVLSNNANYDIFLSNGDFGQIRNILSNTEHKEITIKRRNEENNIVEQIKVNLYFRDVEILFKDEHGKVVLIRCKIIENLLFSENPSLSSDENKAIYLDFVIRNKHLKPNTKEFKDAIKSDPYFNALKIKFGYAITCHKAQGSEWGNIFLNCKSHQSYLSEGYFRWLYTALTRASKKLYTLDEPHIGITNNLNNKNKPIKNYASINNTFNIQDKFLLAIYQKISIIVEENNIKILDIQHKQNQEQYIFESNGEQSRVAIYYTSKNIISTINPIETNNLSSLIKIILEPLKKHILTVEQHNNFTFNEQFLEDFYLVLKDKLSNIKINISNIEHLNYMERYTFSRKNEIAIIDFYYNEKGQFKSPTPNNKSNSQLLIKDIIGNL
jgi:tRNA A37 threonylcarbamoyladenosine biosynthesis protein TsaE